MTTTIRITCSTNSLASKPNLFRDKVLADVEIPCDVRHNGGKVIILTTSAKDISEVIDALDASYMVTSYEVA